MAVGSTGTTSIQTLNLFFSILQPDSEDTGTVVCLKHSWFSIQASVGESLKTFIGMLKAGFTGRRLKRTVELQFQNRQAILDVPRCNNHEVNAGCLMDAGKGFSIRYLLWSNGVITNISKFSVFNRQQHNKSSFCSAAQFTLPQHV